MCLAPLPGGGFASGGNDARLVAWRPSAEVSEGGGGGEQRGGSFVSGGVRVVRETKSGGAIRALAISPDATRWFTAGSEGNVRAWDASDLEGRGFVLLRAFRGGHQGFVTSLAVLPPQSAPESDADKSDAARYVVSGSEGSPGGYWSKGDGAVKVWRVGDGACVCTTPAKQSGDVVAVRPVASRSVLACAASDGTVAEWDVLWPKRRGAGSDDDITWERGFLR
jgi:WD40 repeat protein